MTSGKYFNKNQRIYVASAPRSQNMQGAVIFFLYTNNSEVMDKKYIREGYQYGEYFGASLASCDINADGKDELIVGAPLWTNKADEGRVYIFTAKADAKNVSFDFALLMIVIKVNVFFFFFRNTQWQQRGLMGRLKGRVLALR